LRAIPALIAEPCTARMHTVRRLPDGGNGVTLGSAELASVELPAAPRQRWIALAGGELTEDITSDRVPWRGVGSGLRPQRSPAKPG